VRMLTRILSATVFAACASHAFAADKALGVATCAGSTCHASTQPLGNSTIRQDEYFIWLRRDPHARAWHTLESDASRRIAGNLGLGDPREARVCLDCHVHNVPVARRGERFLLKDGIGCEACHGPAERWIGPHVNGLDGDERVALGMTPTWDPEQRAVLCLSCHQGDAQRPITHAIMGAGHPPLLFELDTFMATMPAHHRIDAGYAARKGDQDSARDWAIGQVKAAELFLEAVASERLRDGVFPELAFFDCNACHNSLHDVRWAPGRIPGLPPGAVRLADAHLVMVHLWLGGVNAELARRWEGRSAALHAATRRDLRSVQSEAATLLQILRSEVRPLVLATRLDAADKRALISRLARHGAGPRSTDYAAAEQTVMAVGVISNSLAGTDPPSTAVRSALDALHDSVRHRDRFDVLRYRAALQQLLRASGA
jgi:hypothetical protein